MVKVIGPLFSLEARCTIGKAITYMKSRVVFFVRTWYSPTEIWSTGYTFQKYIHGGSSKAVARIQRDWIYHDEILKLIFEKADFQAQIIGVLKKTLFKTEEDLENLWLVYFYLPKRGRFITEAKKREFRDYRPPWWSPTYEFSRGFQLYILAELAISIRKTRGGIFNFWPYLKEIADWGETEIQQHAQRVKQE